MKCSVDISSFASTPSSGARSPTSAGSCSCAICLPRVASAASGPALPSPSAFHDPAARAARRRLAEGNPKSEAGRRSVPIPERLMPALKARPDTCPPGAPAIASPKGSRLSLENWKRAVNWRKSVIEVGRAELRVHDLRHTYASLSRRAGADLRLLQKAMGHASITVTAHTYADLFDDELDDIATALDSLDDSFHVSGS